MRFSEFAKLMHSYIGCDRQKQEYVQYLTNLIMRDPQTPEEEAADDDDKFNPLSEIEKDLLGKIYRGNGKNKISEVDARIINSRFSKVKFIDEFMAVEAEARENLVAELAKHGVSATIDNVDEVCAELFSQLITALVDGKDYIDPAMVPKVDSVGKRLTEVPLTSAYVKDGKLCIGGERITLSVQLMVTEEIAPHEQPYINALYEAYNDALQSNIATKDDIELLPPRHKKFFASQRKAYYAAESIQRSVRDVFEDGENQFHILKKDAFEGIQETYWVDHTDGLERLSSVLIKITSTTLNKSALIHIVNLIGNLEKKGICHILVNDDTIQSWVNIDD